MEQLKKALDLLKDNKSFSDSQLAVKNAGSVSLDNLRYVHTRQFITDSKWLSTNRIIAEQSDDIIADAYRMLRTKVLLKMRAHGWNTIGVTSPGKGEGKSLTAINLAISIAREVNYTVLLVDFDLRRPMIHKLLGLSHHKGLSHYIHEDTPLEEILVHPSIERLVVLPGGDALRNSSELLSLPKIVNLIQDIKNRYQDRIIVMDLPPLLMVDDALVLAPYIDTILLVVEEGTTQPQSLNDAIELLGDNVNLLGTVLNKAEVNKKAYY